MTDIRFFYDLYTVYPYYLPFITILKKYLFCIVYKVYICVNNKNL